MLVGLVLVDVLLRRFGFVDVVNELVVLEVLEVLGSGGAVRGAAGSIRGGDAGAEVLALGAEVTGVDTAVV